MRGEIPPEVFEAYLERQRAAETRDARMTARSVLAEMIRHEVADKPLTWRRRRALVRYSQRLGLDEFEARLLVRAAEVGFGGEPPSEPEPIARHYLAAVDDTTRQVGFRWALMALLVMNGIALLWLLRRGG